MRLQVDRHLQICSGHGTSPYTRVRRDPIRLRELNRRGPRLSRTRSNHQQFGSKGWNRQSALMSMLLSRLADSAVASANSPAGSVVLELLCL